MVPALNWVCHGSKERGNHRPDRRGYSRVDGHLVAGRCDRSFQYRRKMFASSGFLVIWNTVIRHCFLLQPVPVCHHVAIRGFQHSAKDGIDGIEANIGNAHGERCGRRWWRRRCGNFRLRCFGAFNGCGCRFRWGRRRFGRRAGNNHYRVFVEREQLTQEFCAFGTCILFNDRAFNAVQFLEFMVFVDCHSSIIFWRVATAYCF